MASARVLGFDYVPGYPALGFGRFGRAGWFRRDILGPSSLPPWIESVTVKKHNGSDPDLWAGYWYAITPSLLWVRVKPIDNRPYLLSLAAPDETAGTRLPTYTVWDAGLVAPLSPTLAATRALNGNIWCRIAARGEVAIEVTTQSTWYDAVVREILFDPWPEAFNGPSDGFVGHGVF